MKQDQAARPDGSELSDGLGPLVEKLRSPWHHGDCRQAADAIQRLSAEVGRLKEHAVTLAETARVVERERCAMAVRETANGCALADNRAQVERFRSVVLELIEGPNVGIQRRP